MRLWHQSLIPLLPRSQLLGQHRECAALRGGGWGKPHRTVNYVFLHPWQSLYRYHRLVMDEMERRGYRVDPLWKAAEYRGKRRPAWEPDGEGSGREGSGKEGSSKEGSGKEGAGEQGSGEQGSDGDVPDMPIPSQGAVLIYPEHDEAYLRECLGNLLAKGIDLAPLLLDRFPPCGIGTEEHS